MALKVIMKRKKLDEKEKALGELREKEKTFETREKDLERSIEEAETEEEKKAVEEAVEEYEKEKDENAEAITKLQEEVEKIKEELATLEDKEPKEEMEPEKGEGEEEERMKRSVQKRKVRFSDMTLEQRSAFVVREDVKEFLERAKSLKGQTRGVTGAELTIPEVMLELLRDEINRYSKLITKVRLKPIKGKARQNIVGEVPEGIWMEAVGKLNELTFKISQIEMDGYKVGGVIVIPNSTLEDSDINLASEIMDQLGQAIGYAVDKAIIYGTGKKMPLGWVTRLAQTVRPADNNQNEPEWKDLHEKNLVKIDGTAKDTQFFATLILAGAKAKRKYNQGERIWIMNEDTEATIMSKAVTFNAAGMIVAQQNGMMPCLNGEIITLNFIPDNDITGGYLSEYTLVEREGANLGQSEHAQFIEDNTVFKGTARYDGKPVNAEGFVAINIANAAPTTSLEFAKDVANEPDTPSA